MSSSPPSDLDITLTLYSNPGCPYVHRATTTLNELNLPYTSHPIDLDTPRPQSYLTINPRGTVPSLTFTSKTYRPGKTTTVNESLIIITFLADLFPNHLLPPTSRSVQDTAERARINFFIDTWGNKIGALLPKILLAQVEGEEAVKGAVEGVVGVIEREIEPLLGKEVGDGDGVFLGGREKFTLAEQHPSSSATLHGQKQV
ncbi:hypothetical protein AA313_de0203416 [Arthrobotrys entomopaga]|nr:hypothetical protein AA313_de0203416 [Arthrobotrys entomopaga]